MIHYRKPTRKSDLIQPDKVGCVHSDTITSDWDIVLFNCCFASRVVPIPLFAYTAYMPIPQ